MVIGEPSGAVVATGGGFGNMGEAIVQELRMLREVLGELKGLKEEFCRLGDRLIDRFAGE
jgi:hypothetical protein